MSAHILPLILKSEHASHEDTLIAVAQGMGRILNRLTLDEKHAWMDSQSKKISRRAKQKDWLKVLSALPSSDRGYEHVKHETAEIIILPPMLPSELSSPIKRLQVSGTDFPRTGTSVDSESKSLCLQMAVDMSTGKASAQVGHAVQYFYMNHPAQFIDWMNRDYPVSLSRELHMGKENLIEVIDAGLSEVAPGTTTVKAGYL